MIATIPSATLVGVEGRPVAVEVHVSSGLPDPLISPMSKG